MSQAVIYGRPAPQPDIVELARRALQPWSDAYETWRSGTSDLLGLAIPQPNTKPKGKCGCESCRGGACESDPCACRCCVSDADLVVETRVGERRVISIEIENHWRRERPIELELSSWTPTPAGVAVTAAVLGPTTFILEPCGERMVVIELAIEGAKQGGDLALERQLQDVTDCVVAYADLRIKGCDMRSLRLAVAILPRTCDPYRADCACGCCC